MKYTIEKIENGWLVEVTGEHYAVARRVHGTDLHGACLTIEADWDRRQREVAKTPREPGQGFE